jgi:long-chain acyl-CoA synthetase
MTAGIMTPGMPHVFPTVLQMLAAAADAAPERVALRCGDERLTYREYTSCVAGFAQNLRGEVRGERVALIMTNSIDTAIATFATLAAGAQAVPLNPAYTSHELRSILADAAPTAIVYDGVLKDMICPLATELGIGRIMEVDAHSRLTRWTGQYLSLPAFPEPHSLAILQYTGGTTGRSKGVNLTHQALSTNVSQREALLPCGDDEKILIVTPMYHSYAIAMGLLLAPYCHGTLSILPRYRPDDALRTIETHGITLFAGSPTLFVGLMAHEAFATTNFSSLKLCFSGASALPMETMRRWEAATRCGICEGYGQSEAGPVLTFNPRDGVRKQGSVGVPLPMTDVQIVDTETGVRALAPNEPGEIRARGPQIMSGYRSRPEETAAALKSGWLHTGDIGAIDQDGYLFILDRKKDMAIVGGFNVYPREIEEVLCSHAAVAEAAVIGVPDDYRGEALVGYVVLRQPDATEAGALASYLAERLTRYKIPRDIRICAALPKTTVGKIDKVALKAVHRS